MLDEFIRSQDGPPITRLNDEIGLVVSRFVVDLCNNDEILTWSKPEDPELIRRWDNDKVFRLEDFPLRRPQDNPEVERQAPSNTFTRK